MLCQPSHPLVLLPVPTKMLILFTLTPCLYRTPLKRKKEKYYCTVQPMQAQLQLLRRRQNLPLHHVRHCPFACVKCDLSLFVTLQFTGSSCLGLPRTDLSIFVTLWVLPQDHKALQNWRQWKISAHRKSNKLKQESSLKKI